MKRKTFTLEFKQVAVRQLDLGQQSPRDLPRYLAEKIARLV